MNYKSYHKLPSFLRPYQTGLCLSTTVVAMIDETLGFGQPLVSILRCQHPLGGKCNYDYYWEQCKYWNERVGHAERDVEILKHSMDYSNYEEYRDAIMDQKNIVMKLKKVEKWYQDKFDEITNKYNIEPSFQ